MKKPYVTEDFLRRRLKAELASGKTQRELAAEIGISTTWLSMLLSDRRRVFSGKVVAWLGYRKVKEPLFEVAA